MGYVIFCILILLVLCCVCFRERVSSEKQCSEEEFLRLMPDDISPETALVVRNILSDVSGWDVDEIWPHTTLVDITEH